MKIVFMGTPQIAVPCLEALINSPHNVIAVVTQPDQKSGRGMAVHYTPVKETALKYGIPCFQPESINNSDALDMLNDFNADIFAVAAYSQKLPDRLLNMAPYGCINMHPSLLPKYRGSGPLRGPILNGDTESGVTIMRLVSRWDAGDILMQESFPIDSKETTATLEGKCKVLGADLMLRTIDGLEANAITPVPQDESKATYLKQISKEEGHIDFHQSAVYIERLIRSCIPWPSAFTFLNGKTFKIWEAETEKLLPGIPNLGHNVMDTCGIETREGSVAYSDKNKILISTGDGYLNPRIVQLEGKKRMTIEDFLKGKKLPAGTQFGK